MNDAKDFHIVNVGVSIITNFQKNSAPSEEVKNAKLPDNDFWKKFLDNSQLMGELFEFVKSAPEKNSAELNAFLRKIKSSNNKIEVYFTGTKTYVNEVCVRTLERFMKDNNITVYTTKEFPGYFLETYQGENKAESFIKGISEMLDHLMKLATRKKEAGYRVYFNPTGGFKAHVIASALAGFMTGCEVYYLNEEFNNLITFPPLFYLPKGRERELLEKLKDKKPKSGKEYEDLEEKFTEEIERLENYGLLERGRDEFGKYFRAQITNKGVLILELIKEV